MDDVIISLSSACSSGCEGLSHVLCLQDTTEIIFSHEGRLSLDDKDFGYGTSEHGKYCIFAHPGMVLDASSRMPVGFGHMKVWSRDRSEERRKKQRRGKVKLEEKWEKHLRHVYPSAKCICILCDGGGSNNARSWQFKWCLMETAKRLGIDIRIAHYPPYCSKWNPIEHRLFSQISRVWSGAVFNTIEEASDMAAKTTTKTGLVVFTTINRNNYETKKERNPLFESECDRHIVKDQILPKWNYLVKC